MERAHRVGGRFDEVCSFIGALYGPDLHAKRVASLAGATLGVMMAASLAVIGHALAQARGLMTKHAVKQLDRLLRVRLESQSERASRRVSSMTEAA
jgi:hypothetical protein